MPNSSTKKRQKVAVIGAGRGGIIFLELLSDYPKLEVVGIAEMDESAPGLQLARKMGIPVTTDYREFAKMEDLDLIVNVTGDPSVGEYIEKEKKGLQEVMGGVSAKLLWNLVYSLKQNEEEKNSFLKKLETANKDLNQTKEYLEDILEHSADIIITTSPDEKIVSFNRGAERILGYQREEVLGKKAEILWKNREGRKELLDLMEKDGFVSNYETELLTKDKLNIQALLTLSYLKNQEGKIVGTVGISKDVTEKKNLELELLRSNQDLEDFVYTISHDLQSPIRGIHGFSKILAQKYKEKLDETGIHYLTRIQKAAERMKLLIDDLLSLSRINMQRSTLEKVNIKKTLEAVHDLFHHDLISGNGELRYPENLPSITCDCTRIQQVFNNLVSNALKYCKEKPRIEIRYAERDDLHEFSVKDNGIGIHPDYQHKIFDIFQRLHKNEEYQGTGIGLTIVKKIVEFHQGTIWVESVPNEGTTFYFTISKDLEFGNA